jgi:hypothetical protein
MKALRGSKRDFGSQTSDATRDQDDGDVREDGYRDVTSDDYGRMAAAVEPLDVVDIAALQSSGSLSSSLAPSAKPAWPIQSS